MMDVKDVVERFNEGLGRLAKFDKHPIGQQIIRESKEARLAERKALVAKVGALKAAHETARPTLVNARDAAATALAQARAAFVRATTALSEAEQALGSANVSTEVQVAALEKELRASAPEVIGAFVAELDSWADRVRLQKPIELDVPRGFSGSLVTIGSNYRAIVRAIERCRATRQAAEGLALEALSEADLATRLQELREELGAEPTAADIEPSLPEYAGRVKAHLERARGGDPLPAA